MVARQIVALKVVGSSPTIHPEKRQKQTLLPFLSEIPDILRIFNIYVK